MSDFEAAVAAKVPDGFQPVVAALRRLMQEWAPDVREAVRHGSPSWRAGGPLAIISITKSHLTLAFDRGAEFDDRHGLLAGTGTKSRHVKLKSAATIDEEALRDYIAQALRLDGV